MHAEGGGGGAGRRAKEGRDARIEELAHEQLARGLLDAAQRDDEAGDAGEGELGAAVQQQRAARLVLQHQPVLGRGVAGARRDGRVRVGVQRGGARHLPEQRAHHPALFLQLHPNQLLAHRNVVAAAAVVVAVSERVGAQHCAQRAQTRKVERRVLALVVGAPQHQPAKVAAAARRRSRRPLAPAPGARRRRPAQIKRQRQIQLALHDPHTHTVFFLAPNEIFWSDKTLGSRGSLVSLFLKEKTLSLLCFGGFHFFFFPPKKKKKRFLFFVKCKLCWLSSRVCLLLDPRRFGFLIGKTFTQCTGRTPSSLRTSSTRRARQVEREEAKFCACSLTTCVSAVKYLSDGGEGAGLASQNVTARLLPDMLRRLVREENWAFEIWAQKQSGWELCSRGSPGNFDEGEFGEFGEEEERAQGPGVMAALHVGREAGGALVVGLAYVDALRSLLGLAQFADAEALPNAETALVQLGVSECAVPKEGARGASPLLKAMLARADIGKLGKKDLSLGFVLTPKNASRHRARQQRLCRRRAALQRGPAPPRSCPSRRQGRNDAGNDAGFDGYLCVSFSPFFFF
jgi:hypothetical protein